MRTILLVCEEAFHLERVSSGYCSVEHTYVFVEDLGDVPCRLRVGH